MSEAFISESKTGCFRSGDTIWSRYIERYPERGLGDITRQVYAAAPVSTSRRCDRSEVYDEVGMNHGAVGRKVVLSFDEIRQLIPLISSLGQSLIAQLPN